ncbi:hypothetical protein B0H19DRAFT_1255007 [Mycena capillaripes]|nr:hypothetical protein B0H19DRAFT_1255007 [Mycena capillaripes]
MNRLIRARVLVVSTFFFATLFQGDALFTQRDPSNHAVYAPHPYFLITFFALQVGLQSCWILQIFRNVHGSAPVLLSGDDGGFGISIEESNSGEPTQMAYVHLYALGNLFIVGSMAAGTSEHLALSQVCVTLDTACQLYFVLFALSPAGKHAWASKNKLTHLVAKTSAGVAILYMWRAWGVIQIGPFRPAIQQQVHCGVLVLLLAFASGPDPTLGICMLLDLAALAVGDTKEEWKVAFSCIMDVLFVVIAFDCLLAWRRGRAPHNVSLPRTDSEDEESALHESEQIWLSDMPTEVVHRA